MGSHLSCDSSSSSSSCESSCHVDRFRDCFECEVVGNCAAARLVDTNLTRDQIGAIVLEANAILETKDKDAECGKHNFEKRKKALRCLIDKYEHYFNPYWPYTFSYTQDALGVEYLNFVAVVGRYYISFAASWTPIGWVYAGMPLIGCKERSILDYVLLRLPECWDKCQCLALTKNEDWVNCAYSTGEFPVVGSDVQFTKFTRPYVKIDDRLCDTDDETVTFTISAINFPLTGPNCNRSARIFLNGKMVKCINSCEEPITICLKKCKHKKKKFTLAVLLYYCDKYIGVGDARKFCQYRRSCGGCGHYKCRCGDSSSSSSSSSSCSSSSSSSSSSRWDVPKKPKCSCKNVVKIGHRAGCELNPQRA